MLPAGKDLGNSSSCSPPNLGGPQGSEDEPHKSHEQAAEHAAETVDGHWGMPMAEYGAEGQLRRFWACQSPVHSSEGQPAAAWSSQPGQYTPRPQWQQVQKAPPALLAQSRGPSSMYQSGATVQATPGDEPGPVSSSLVMRAKTCNDASQKLSTDTSSNVCCREAERASIR